MKQLLLAIFTILVCACSTCKVSTQNQISEIKFGRGGGFTNQVEQFSLNKKGELSKNGKVIGRASCEEVERLFLMADALQQPFNEPSNFYWFIELKGKEDKTFIWGSSSDVDKAVVNLFSELNKLK